VLEVSGGTRSAQRGNDQKLYLNGPLTARPIAKVNVLVCANPVLTKANNVLVRVVAAYVLNELLQIKYRVFIVLLDSRAMETMNIFVRINVPITRFLSQFMCPPFGIILGRVT
jgi:hypothetical protein